MDNRKDIIIGQLDLAKTVSICDPFYLKGAGLFNIPVVPGRYNCHQETATINGVLETISVSIIKANDDGSDMETPDFEKWESLYTISSSAYAGFYEGNRRSDTEMQARKSLFEDDKTGEEYDYILYGGPLAEYPEDVYKGAIFRFMDFQRYPLYGLKDDQGNLYAALIYTLSE